MKIGEITNLASGAQSLNITDKVKNSPEKNLFTSLIEKVKNDQNESTKLTKDFINGQGVEIHEVMIAGEKAQTSFQLLMEIRNKALDMYKELTRIQI